MMPAGDPASFSSSEYWDNRFTSDSNPFDWLHPANVLDEHLHNAIAKLEEQGVKPKILHIGCGTSLLSLQLRGLVDDPEQIWNVDFSKKAVDIGRRWEQELVRSGVWDSLDGSTKPLSKIQEVLSEVQKRRTDSPVGEREDAVPVADGAKRMMHWEAVDLLSLTSISSVLPMENFDIIVEKSCSDAIACGDDIPFDSLEPKTSIISHYAPSSTREESPSNEASLVHPVSLLALHLARLARPTCLWMMLTFSEDRVLFKPGPFRKPIHMPHPLPDPIKHWTPILKQAVTTPESGPTVAGGEATVYRPEVYHFIEILKRARDDHET